MKRVDIQPSQGLLCINNVNIAFVCIQSQKYYSYFTLVAFTYAVSCQYKYSQASDYCLMDILVHLSVWSHLHILNVSVHADFLAKLLFSFVFFIYFLINKLFSTVVSGWGIKKMKEMILMPRNESLPLQTRLYVRLNEIELRTCDMSFLNLHTKLRQTNELSLLNRDFASMKSLSISKVQIYCSNINFTKMCLTAK